MLRSLDNKKSWVTQRLANRFPPWSKVRQLGQSIGQQILEPAAKRIEDLYWWTNYNLGNFLLNTSDLHQLEKLYYFYLPSNFSWRTSQHTDSTVFLTPTSVKGKTSTGWVTLTLAEDNYLEEFWYGLPTRVSLAGESFTYKPILSPTFISDLGSISTVSPSIPSKLFVTLSNNGSSIKNYKGMSIRSSIKITGRDIHGKKNTEKVYFIFNGTTQTKTTWSEITSIETKYIDSDAYLRIDWLSAGQSEFLDTNGIVVDTSREKVRFFSLGNKSFGSTLNYLVFSADDFVLVQEGQDDKHSYAEVQLLDSSSTNINGTSLSLWPKRKWIIVSDGSKLHFFSPGLNIEKLDSTASSTTEAVVQLATNQEWCCQGDTVTLDYTMRRPFVRVLRTRLSVIKPNGTRVGISETGAEVAYSSSGWINHTADNLFQKVGFQGNYVNYQITEKGKYEFYLESTIADLLSSESQTRPINHTYVYILQSLSESAETSISLPASLGVGNTICFDCYQRPWIINSNGVAYRLIFHYDKYLADYTNKNLILRENYDSIEIEA